MYQRLAIILIIVLSLGLVPVFAQSGANAWTTGPLNLRCGPSTHQTAITQLGARTPLVLEARSDDQAWLLVHTEDSALRGWVSTAYIEYSTGIILAELPVSEEVMPGGAAPAAAVEGESEPAVLSNSGGLISQTLLYNTGHSEYYRIMYWSEGLRVTGYLGFPTGQGPYPAIIYNRGGLGDSGALTGREIVPLVEAGYVAIGSNYRGNAGSEGGDQFAWGDVTDSLNLIPVLQSLPMVDASRIGMMGGSRGGLVTYMALKTESMNGYHNIRAAVTVGGIADLFAWADERPSIVDALYLPQFGVTPDESPDQYAMRSAVYWPRLINTPLLLLHGEADSEVSVQQSCHLYDLLIANGRTARLVTYPGDDHPLSGQLGGFPEALRWFAIYLSRPGDPDRQFDTHWADIDAVSQWFWYNRP
jgi:dienelactone hydrolase